jgi:hypothetical protein
MLLSIVRKNHVKRRDGITSKSFKGDYINMNTFIQCDWNDILKGKNAGWTAV